MENTTATGMDNTDFPQLCQAMTRGEDGPGPTVWFMLIFPCCARFYQKPVQPFHHVRLVWRNPQFFPHNPIVAC